MIFTSETKTLLMCALSTHYNKIAEEGASFWLIKKFEQLERDIGDAVVIEDYDADEPLIENDEDADEFVAELSERELYVLLEAIIYRLDHEEALDHSMRADEDDHSDLFDDLPSDCEPREETTIPANG